MKAGNLNWVGEVELIVDGVYLDVHNCYDFCLMQHDVSKRRLKLFWRRGTGDWIDGSLPSDLTICFTDVNYFLAKPRDPKIPFSEDDCLANFGYDSDEGWADGPFFQEAPVSADWRWSFEFQSGAQMVVGAKSVEAILDF